jgi:hypothetical protein
MNRAFNCSRFSTAGISQSEGRAASRDGWQRTGMIEATTKETAGMPALDIAAP